MTNLTHPNITHAAFESGVTYTTNSLDDFWSVGRDFKHFEKTCNLRLKNLPPLLVPLEVENWGKKQELILKQIDPLLDQSTEFYYFRL